MRKTLRLSIVTLFLSFLSIIAKSQSCGSVGSGFRTQKQEGWSVDPDGKNAGEYLKNHFSSCFPHGLTIGCGSKTVKFTKPESIKKCLPAIGTPKSLNSGNDEDPSGSLVSELEGQLV